VLALGTLEVDVSGIAAVRKERKEKEEKKGKEGASAWKCMDIYVVIFRVIVQL